MIVVPRSLFLALVVLCSVEAFSANGGRRVLVQLAAPLTPALREELARDGLTLGRPVAGDRHLAMLGHGANFQNDPRIAAIEPLAAKHKVHGTAKREVARPKPAAALNVFFHDDVSFDEARAAIDAVGGSYDALQTGFRHGHRLVAHVPGYRLNALAGDDRVLTITHAVQRRKTSRNADSAVLSRVNLVHAAPYGLTGQGIVLSLFDLGEAYYAHGDFGGRLTTHVSEGANDGHATHVAGTIGGSGAGNAHAKGMAPASTMHQFRVDDDDNEITLAIKEGSLAPLGVVADNNSWGYVLGWDGFTWWDLEEYMGAYSLDYSAPLDDIAIEKNILFIHSAGNDAIPSGLDQNGTHFHWDTESDYWCYSQNGSGNDCPPPCTPGRCETVRHMQNAPWTTIGDTESAKNILIVGAANSDKSLASYSSRGPARDGRVKPELVARGNYVFSTTPFGYGQMSGTSTAAPVVTGVAGLLTEQWRTTFGASPTIAQLRTLLIAGAEDLGTTGPDYSFGFGLVDAQASIDLVRTDAATGTRIRGDSLAQEQQYAVDIVLAAPQTLRVVLGWTDPEALFLGGSDIASPALVNDLDVQVLDASNNTTFPYVLDKNNPSVAATRAANHVDNTEMVEIANAAAGTYRIVVTATDINAASPQAFVLTANAPLVSSVVSNVVLTATGSATPSVSLNWTSAGPGATYDVYFRDGAGSYSLRVAGLTTTSYIDNNVSANAAYLYKLLVHVPGAASAWTNPDLATTLTFDAALAAGSPIQLAHVTQLATVANLLRGLAGLGAIAWTTTPLTGGLVRASQVTDLRTDIGAARTALSLPAATFTRTLTPGSTTILATDFTEIRTALQ